MAIYKGEELIAGLPLPSQTGQSGKFLTTNGTNPSWANVSGGSGNPDNETISLNASQQLQTIGIKDNRDATTLKYWTGTKAQFQAIATKDNNTIYNITDDEGEGGALEVGFSDLTGQPSDNTNLATALNGKAGTDLSNLSATGEAHFDGRYVNVTGDTMSGNLTVNGILTSNGGFEAGYIELGKNIPAGTGFGGFIDFHYDGSTADYTARIIEYQNLFNIETLNHNKPISLNGSNGVYLKVTYVNGLSGFNIWTNGYCEQWGNTSDRSSGTTDTIYFAKTFINNMYNAQISIVGYKAGSDTNIRVQERSTNYMVIYAQEAETPIMWRACGYLASGQY